MYAQLRRIVLVAVLAASGLVATWLVLSSGDDDSVGIAEGGPVVGAVPVGDDALLQVLGVLLVLLATTWLGTLAASRNDLQSTAESLEPKITEALELIREADPMLARMSGSGATCFGLYRTQVSLDRALTKLEAARPEWYLQGAAIHRP